MMAEASTLAFYRTHSRFTDPGAWRAMLDSLPTTISGLVAVVQGHIVHPAAVERYGLPPGPETDGRHLRFVADMLAHIAGRDPSPLVVPREPGLRLRGNCRNDAVLLVALLRHLGIPARKRTGFALYLDFIHEIAEYWDAGRTRWTLVDPNVPLDTQAAYLRARGYAGPASHEALDLRAGDAFITGGVAWLRCRHTLADPCTFRGAGSGDGMPGVRQALLQDLDGLNRIELLSHDWWGGELDTRPHEALSEEDLAVLDRGAELTLRPDERHQEMLRYYADFSHGRAVLARLGDMQARRPA